MKHYKITPTETYESIKLGIDAHAKWYCVARQLDGATPQPLQKMDFEGLLHFVARQKQKPAKSTPVSRREVFLIHEHITQEGPWFHAAQLRPEVRLDSLNPSPCQIVEVAERAERFPGITLPDRRHVDRGFPSPIQIEANPPEKTMPKFHARVHAILARDAKTAVIIRRGPSRSVCTIGWDLRSDTFKLGQWLRGRIYERRCDISPDGKHFTSP